MQVLSILLVFSILINVFFLLERSNDADVVESQRTSESVSLTSTGSAPVLPNDLSRETAIRVKESVNKRRPQKKSISRLEISDLLAKFKEGLYLEDFANNCKYKSVCTPLVSLLKSRISKLDEPEKTSRMKDLVEMRIRICETEANLPKIKGVWTVGIPGACQEKFEVAPSEKQLKRLTANCEKLSAESCVSLYHNDPSLGSDQKKALLEKACGQDFGEGCALLADLTSGKDRVRYLEKSCLKFQHESCKTLLDENEKVSSEIASMLKFQCEREYDVCKMLESKDMISPLKYLGLQQSFCLSFDFQACRDLIYGLDDEVKQTLKISKESICSMLEAEIPEQMWKDLENDPERTKFCDRKCLERDQIRDIESGCHTLL